MTHVEIEINDRYIIIRMTGHAGYSEKGSDIVCSAISTLEYILYGYVKSNPKVATMKRYETGTGYSYMHIIPKKEGIYDVIKAAVIGFEGIADSYPDYIDFKKIEKAGENKKNVGYNHI